MKKFIKLICVAVAVIMLLSQAVLAAEFMVMYGKADSDTTMVSLLVLDSSVTDRTKIEGSDVKYIDQSEVDENGNFSIILPFFDENEYGIYSNLDFSIINGVEKMTCYVSSSGDDTNNGLSADEPVKTLSAAYSKIDLIDEIVLLDDTVYSEVPSHAEMLTIKGKTASVKLTLPSEVSLNGPLTIDNVLLSGTASRIYANGHKFKVTETVTSDAGNGTSANGKSFYVYGGKKSADYTGDTDIELLGGKYYRVYGGGYNGPVYGNTNVVLGGTANAGDGINDQDSATIAGCYVFGGGENGAVTGKTNVTVKDSAVSKFVVGAGNGASGSVPETNIYINGGKVMNVYGGSTNTALENCNTHVTMTGGLVEAIFGGSESAAMTGNTYINLVGGEISRRVYSGCYNEWKITWSSNNFVTGTTNLVIYPKAIVASGTGLDIVNRLDMGIGVGSRDNSNHNEEISTVIFFDDCYSVNKNKIGATYGKHADYTVRASEGGEVIGTTTGGKVLIKPDNGYYAVIGSSQYETEEVALSSSTTDVTFKKKDFFIYDVSATKGENSADGSADINADNSTANEAEPKLYISVFEYGANKLIDCAVSEAVTGINEFKLNCTFEEGKKYIIKAMMWNGDMEPLTSVYSFELK